MQIIHCRACGQPLSSEASFCPVCGAATLRVTEDPHLVANVLGAGLIVGTMWVMDQVRKTVLTPFVEERVREKARSFQRDIDRMLEACAAKDYRRAISIGRSVSIPSYYPDDIRDKILARFKLIQGYAELLAGDSENALNTLTDHIEFQSKIVFSNEDLAIAHLLIAEACYKEIKRKPSKAASLVVDGLQSMNEVIKRLPPQADFHALRALLYACSGRAKHAVYDAELALMMEPGHEQATDVLDLVRRVT